jgi:hypothetical protein
VVNDYDRSAEVRALNRFGQDLLIAQRILEEALHDPELAGVIDTMLADQSVTKEQLFSTAFAQGVISTLSALRQGRLIDLRSN